MSMDEQNEVRGRRRRVSPLKEPGAVIDYKNPQLLKHFLSDRGKIVPRRISGTCARHQTQITTAVKRARILAMLPFTSDQLR